MSSKSQPDSFSLFNYLHDDLKVTVLSYVADAPFESRNITIPTSSLTHILPQVSRKFRFLCNTEYYWKDALVRQIMAEPFLWKRALHRILNLPLTQNEDAESAEQLVMKAFKQQKYVDFKDMYRDIVKNHLRFVGPVFYMCGQVALGQPYSLHFFEPRYRMLIAEVMKDQPLDAKRGGRIVGDSTLFIHANRGPLAPTTPATLVQVLSCEIFEDGRANVVLLPVAYVWLEKLWVRPNSGQLYFAQCLRMGKEVTKSMNHLARQEQLAYVMTQLAHDLNDEEPMTSSGSESE
ncbi:hypothetical protein ACA910_007726 [Epithemia clementina (nom. ined.)]